MFPDSSFTKSNCSDFVANNE